MAKKKKPVDEVKVTYEYKPKTYWDEIDLYSMLMETQKYTQSEICRLYGIKQSTLSNKLRLKKLPRSVCEVLKKSGLSERHARALLVVKNELQQHAIIKAILSEGLTVSQTERMILQLGYESERRNVYRRLQRTRKSKKQEENFNGLALNVQEVRLFVMNLKSSMKQLKKAGLDVRAAQFDRDDYFEFVVRIMKDNTGVEMKGA